MSNPILPKGGTKRDREAAQNPFLAEAERLVPEQPKANRYSVDTERLLPDKPKTPFRIRCSSSTRSKAVSKCADILRAYEAECKAIEDGKGRTVKCAYSLRAWGEYCHGPVDSRELVGAFTKAKKRMGIGQLDNHRGNLRKWVYPSHGDLLLTDLTRAHCEEIEAKVIASKKEASTSTNVILSISRLYSFAHEQGSYDPKLQVIPKGYNPTAGMARDRSPQTREDGSVLAERAMDSEERKRFLRAASTDIAANDMDLFCTMSLETGPRVGELLGLPWSKINLKNLDEATITYSQQARPKRGGKAPTMTIVAHTKNFRKRTIPISLRLAERLKLRKESAPGTLFVFVAPGHLNQPMHYDFVKDAIDRIAKAAGLADNVDEQGLPIKDPGPHDLRHTFATMNANELDPLMGLADLAYMLGDTKETVAKHYLHHNVRRLRTHIERAVACGLI